MMVKKGAWVRLTEQVLNTTKGTFMRLRNDLHTLEDKAMVIMSNREVYLEDHQYVFGLGDDDDKENN